MIALTLCGVFAGLALNSVWAGLFVAWLLVFINEKTGERKETAHDSKQYYEQRARDMAQLRHKGMSFQYIGDRYNLTRQRAHQIISEFTHGVPPTPEAQAAPQGNDAEEH